MISGASVINAVAAYSIAMMIVCVMRKWTGFLKKGGVPAVLLLAVFASVRLILPIEISFTCAIQSWNVLGGTLKFFRTYPVITWLLLFVWSVGAAIFVKNDVVALRRSNEECKSYTVVESVLVQRVAEELAIPCPVVVSPDVEVPYVGGIFRHTIYLPVLDLPKDRLKLVLLHEVQHIRNHDSWIKLFFEFLSAVLWWNPIAHWFRGDLDALLEMRCDAKVTKGMSEAERLEYGKTLTAVARQIVDERELAALALSKSRAAGKSSVLTQRTHVFLEPDSMLSRCICAVAQCVVVVLFCASYLVIFQPAIAPLEEEFQDDLRTYYEEAYEDLKFGEGPNSAFIYKGTDGRYQLFIGYEFSRFLTEDEVSSDQYKDLYVYEVSRQ